MKKDKKEKVKKPGLIQRLIINAVVNFLSKHINIDFMKGSWKTTLGGAISAIGAFLITQDDPAWLSIVGQILMGLGTFIIGASARDNSVSSEEAGAK